MKYVKGNGVGGLTEAMEPTFVPKWRKLKSQNGSKHYGWLIQMGKGLQRKLNAHCLTIFTERGSELITE